MTTPFPGPRRVARVLVTDDSVVIRRMLVDSISSSPQIEVIATAQNGRIALAKLDAGLRPDVVILDVEMPEMDGLSTLKEIRRRHGKLPVIMFSTLTEQGAQTTLDALASGASDYVAKPANVGSVGEAVATVRRELIPKICALAGVVLPDDPAPVLPASAPVTPARPRRASTMPVAAVVVGSSTGGPEALMTVFSQLPAELPVPVLITQHMPPVFTAMFAQRLDRLWPGRVVEAVDGMPIEAGRVYVAPGDHHMEVRRPGRGTPVVAVTSGPPENFCRPAVDVMFRSAVAHWGGSLLGVVLTGMGADGREGARRIVDAGGSVVVQDKATSVVWGMPGAVFAAGLADAVVPLRDVAPTIVHRLRPRVGAGAASA